MKVSVPNYATGVLAHVFEKHWIAAVSMAFSAGEWTIVFDGPANPVALKAAIERIGGTIIEEVEGG